MSEREPIDSPSLIRMNPDSETDEPSLDEEFEVALEELIRRADTRDIPNETWFTFRHPDPDATDWEVQLTRLEDPDARD